MFDKLIDFLISIIKIFQFTMVVHAWQKGIRLRLGKFQAILHPGLHFYFPFWIDKILTENVATETMRVKPQSVTTKDGKSVVVSAVVTFRIEDIRTFLLDVEGRNNVVEDCTYGPIANYVMKRDWPELCALESLDNEFTKVVRRQAKKYGVDVLSVQIIDFVQCRPLHLITATSATPHNPQG